MKLSSANRPIAAFTLIELMAVILISVLLLAIGVAGYSEMRKSLGVGTAARHVAEQLDCARQTAMAMQVRTRYIINSGAGRGAVVRVIPGMPGPSGNPVWQWVVEWHQLPTGVGYLGTNAGSPGTLELLPSLYTVIGTVGYQSYPSTGNAGMTGGWNEVTGSWILLTNSIASYTGGANYRAVEFSPEGRPSQTLTVTVGRGSAEYSYIIVDGLTGKTKVERR
jgi:type II secretory pathway pseudopilin PulG